MIDAIPKDNKAVVVPHKDKEFKLSNMITTCLSHYDVPILYSKDVKLCFELIELDLLEKYHNVAMPIIELIKNRVGKLE